MGDLKKGDRVNLEGALRHDALNSGHNVQGHVDDTGTIREFKAEGDSLWVYINAPATVLPNIVKKGYIAVDGTSLTVCEVERNSDGSGWFSLMLISHTQSCIVLPHKKKGARVNLEADVLGKYAAEAARRQIATLEDRIAAMEDRVNAMGDCTDRLKATRLLVGGLAVCVGLAVGRFMSGRQRVGY